jgi:type 1 fimbriae regulatory protein FimB/type 1 fimbriae regulatory protein FimE
MPANTNYSRRGSEHSAPSSQFPDRASCSTERGGPFTPDAVNRLVKRIGAPARLAFTIHAHMLRHGCGYALANAGHDTRRIQDWLGHRSIAHTTRYTQLSAAPFKDFWRYSPPFSKCFLAV